MSKELSINPFASTLLPLFRSLKLKKRKTIAYEPTIIDKICGLEGNSKKRLLEQFFKEAAYRAIFNYFFDDLINNGYKPN